MACPAPFAKIFLFQSDPNQFTDSCRPVPSEGRSRVVTNAGRDAVDARAPGALAIAGRHEPRERFAACKMIGALAYGEAVWFWHPLLVLNSRRLVGPTGLRQTFNPRMTVTRRIRRRGEHEISR